MPPDPKPRKRIKSALGLTAMNEKVSAEGRCRMCGKPNRPWERNGKIHNTLSRHHIVSRAQGGDDVPENCMPLCETPVWGSGKSSGCHPDVTENRGAARKLAGSLLKPEETAYVLERKGEWWLERNYSVRPSH